MRNVAKTDKLSFDEDGRTSKRRRPGLSPPSRPFDSKRSLSGKGNSISPTPCAASGCSTIRRDSTLSAGLRRALAWAMLLLGISSGVAAGSKRVLIIHSFGNASPPFTTEAIAFETELTERSGERFDIDEVSLDHSRYGGSEMEEALVEYLTKRQAKWQPDLVVPLGSPAGLFVAAHRDRLFPGKPILYAAMDQSRLPPNELEKNAAFVGTKFNVPGLVEDILQVAPATTNIAVVIGASEVEQYWAAAFQKEFEPFTNRVGFT